MLTFQLDQSQLASQLADRTLICQLARDVLVTRTDRQVLALFDLINSTITDPGCKELLPPVLGARHIFFALDRPSRKRDCNDNWEFCPGFSDLYAIDNVELKKILLFWFTFNGDRFHHLMPRQLEMLQAQHKLALEKAGNNRASFDATDALYQAYCREYTTLRAAGVDYLAGMCAEPSIDISMIALTTCAIVLMNPHRPLWLERPGVCLGAERQIQPAKADELREEIVRQSALADSVPGPSVLTLAQHCVESWKFSIYDYFDGYGLPTNRYNILSFRQLLLAEVVKAPVEVKKKE